MDNQSNQDPLSLQQIERMKRSQAIMKKNIESLLDHSFPSWREYQDFLIYYTIGKQAVIGYIPYGLRVEYDEINDPYGAKCFLLGYTLCEICWELSRYPMAKEYIWFYVVSSQLSDVLKEAIPSEFKGKESDSSNNARKRRK
jgi:hypothetical protein